MSFLNRLFRKQAVGQPMLAVSQIGQAQSTPRNYKGFSEEGYQKNVIAFRAVKGIADAVKGIPWALYNSGSELSEIETHPVLDLLRRPNPMQGQAQLFEALTAFYFISGNSYIYAAGPAPGKLPQELWVLRPDKMKVVPGSLGLPMAYQFGENDSKKVFPVDQITMSSAICHVKSFNPLNEWYGMSPIEAASYAIDQHNEAGKWNLALLQNKATPSGVITVSVSDSNPAGTLDEKSFDRIKRGLDHHYSGAANAGRPLLLEGGLSWTQAGLSPQDMDWLEGRNVSAKEVALAFGFPPVLLGIKGDSTYNNIKEAKLALYEDTVIPFMCHLRDQLNQWLVKPFGDNLYLDFDKDDIDVIAEKRSILWDKMNQASFLTTNEKRDALGYEPVDGGDEILVQTTLIPLGMAMDPQVGQPSTIPNQGDYPDRTKPGNEPDDEDPDEELEEDDAEDDLEDFGKLVLHPREFKASQTRFDDFVSRWIIKRTGENITRIYGTTRDKILNAIKRAQVDHVENGTTLTEFSNQINENIGDEYAKFSDSRATLIARTETSIASNQGSMEAAKSLQLPGLQKEWVGANDSRERGVDPKDATSHVAMNGAVVGIDEKFLVPSRDGNDEMDGPGDPHAPADQICNCRCVLTYHREGGKSFGLESQAAKRKYWLQSIKRRQRYEAKMASQIKAVFQLERDHVLEAVKGIHDAKLAEYAALAAMDKTKPHMERVLKANLEIILKDFGHQILKTVSGS